MHTAPGRASPAHGYVGSYGTSQQGVLVPVALATKMADARVEYERVDLQSYEARNGASFAHLRLSTSLAFRRCIAG